jgi:hypothetical protein
MAQYIDEVISGAGDDSAVIDWPGGAGVFLAQGDPGDFGGITLTLKFQIDNTNWTTVKDRNGNNVVFTDNGMASFELCPCKLWVEGTGGTVVTSVAIRVAPARHGWYNDPSLL